jgi:hypothetical protein
LSNKLKFKHFKSFALWIGLLFVVLRIGYKLFGTYDISLAFAQAPPARPAHTIFLTETVASVDGTVSNRRKLVSAVRSDGAEMEGELYPAQMSAARELYLPSNRIHSVVFDLAGIKTSTPLDPARWKNRPRPDPGKNCSVDFRGGPMYTRPVEFLRYEDVGGYRTAVLRLGNITAWHALSVDCALLKQRAEFPDCVEEKLFESLQLGEPDAKYFDVSGTIQEASPSEVRSRLFGPLSVRPEDRKDDERYRKLNETKSL